MDGNFRNGSVTSVKVPTLMEGGMDGLTGIERGRMWLPESVLRTAGAVGRETRGGVGP